jgi:hypothetical protein
MNIIFKYGIGWTIITARYKHKHFIIGFLDYATGITLFNFYQPQM